MRCKQVQNLIAAYLDNEVTLDERKQLDGHLSICSNCREEFASAAGTHEQIARSAQTLSDRIPSSADMWLGIKRRIAVEDHTNAPVWELAKSKFQQRKEGAMKALFSKQPAWKFAVISSVVIIALIVGLTLGLPSENVKNAYAQAEQIARNSPQVLNVLGGKVKDVKVISIVDNMGTVVCYGENGKIAVSRVDLLRGGGCSVSLIELSGADRQKAVDIAESDPRVKAFLDRGAEIVNVSVMYDFNIAVYSEATLPITDSAIRVCLTTKLGDEIVNCIVNLEKGAVEDFFTPLSVSMSTEEKIRRATDIVNADPRIKQLLDDGATIAEVLPSDAFSTSIIREMPADWPADVPLNNVPVKNVTAELTCGASVSLIDETRTDVREWYIYVDLSEERVTDFTEWPNNYTIPLPSTGPFPEESIREITRIVERHPSLWYLMQHGASIVAIEPLRDWGCKDFSYNSSTPVGECPDGVRISYAKLTLVLGNETCVVLVDPSRKLVESIENDISLSPDSGTSK